MDYINTRNALKKAVAYINTLETRGIHNAEVICMIVNELQSADAALGELEEKENDNGSK